MKKSTILLIASFALLAVSVPLLFLVGLDRFEFRSFNKIWNFGHVPLFMAFTFIALHSWKHFFPEKYPKNYLTVCFIVIPASLALGGLIEVIQHFGGRFGSLEDLTNDLLGTMLLLCLFAPRKDSLQLRLPLYGFTLLLMLKQVIPMGIEIIDDIAMYRSFPVLANMEVPLQTTRFEERINSKLSRTDTHAEEGKYSLKVETNGEDFSGFSLEYMKPDWSGYSHFNFALFNPGDTVFTLDCQVYDYPHRNAGKPWGDRFHVTIRLFPGWNYYGYTISKLLKTPKGRRMNRRQIADFNCYTYKDPEPRVFYLDAVHLSNPVKQKAGS